MSRRIALWLLLFLSFQAGAVPVAQRSVSYTGADGITYDAIVFEPVASGQYPLFIWVPGTNEAYNTPAALKIARTMAERGTVAVTVSYNNTYSGPWTCDSFDARAEALFDAKRSRSLLAILIENSPKLDVSRGIAVAGHSLGSWIAKRAGDFSPDVRAAWLLGVGYLAFGNIDTCSRVSQNRLRKIRAINGVHDYVYGGTQATNLEQLQQVTGVCVGCRETVKFDSAGVGYAIVQDADVRASTPRNIAEHFYFLQKPGQTELDPDWDTTSQYWGRQANQQWLMNQLTPCLGNTEGGRLARALHQDVLGRTASSLDVVPYTDYNVLDANVRRSMVRSLAFSEEGKKRFISTYYQKLLKRPADGNGLQNYYNQMAYVGWNLGQVYRDLLRSDEYYVRSGNLIQSFVTALYVDTLGRNPDPAGLQGWSYAFVASGKEAVLSGILSSAEFQNNTIDGVYRSYLRRGMDAIGQQTWGQYIASGDFESVIQGILASEEYLGQALTRFPAGCY